MRRPTTRFGSVIREARLDVGLTASGLAAKVGVRRQSVSSWELGKTEPSDRHLPKLAEVLEQDYSQLVRVLQSEDPVFANDTSTGLSGEALAIARDIRTYDEVLREESRIRKGGRVIVAGLSRAKDSEDDAVVEISVSNLRNGIPYVFALPTTEGFERNRSAILRHFDKSVRASVNDRLTHCQISADNLRAVGGDRIFSVISTAAVILDESGLVVAGHPPVRGYQYVEHLDRPQGFFFPITTRTLNELVALIDKIITPTKKGNSEK